MVSEYYARACLEDFRVHLCALHVPEDDDDDVAKEEKPPFSLFHRTVGGGAMPPGMGAGSAGGDYSPLSLHAQSAGGDGNGARWRGLLTRMGSSYLPTSSGPHGVVDGATNSLTFGSSPPPSTVNMDRMTYMRLYEKYEALQTAATLKDNAFSGDVAVLRTLKLRTDSWSMLAKSYHMLARSAYSQLQPVPALSHGGNLPQRDPSLFLSGQAHAQSILLGPFRQYVSALAKTVEATSSQTSLEGSAEEAIHQLLRAVGLHLSGVQSNVPAIRGKQLSHNKGGPASDPTLDGELFGSPVL